MLKSHNQEEKAPEFSSRLCPQVQHQHLSTVLGDGFLPALLSLPCLPSFLSLLPQSPLGHSSDRTPPCGGVHRFSWCPGTRGTLARSSTHLTCLSRLTDGNLAWVHKPCELFYAQISYDIPCLCLPGKPRLVLHSSTQTRNPARGFPALTLGLGTFTYYSSSAPGCGAVCPS